MPGTLVFEVAGMLRATQAWRLRAACATSDLAPWFTAEVVPTEMRGALRQVCRDCPVAAECLSYAVGHRTTAGTWAGRSFNKWGGHDD